MGNGQIDRRAFLGAGAAGCAGLILGTTRTWASDTQPGAIVETSYGRIRGLVIDKVNAFKGIRYGAPTSGANRQSQSQGSAQLARFRYHKARHHAAQQRLQSS